MKAQYDTEEIKITPRFKAALIELMKAECEMLTLNEPDNADCWTWGICEVDDLSRSSGLQFTFGGDEDKAAGARFKVIPANAKGQRPHDDWLERKVESQLEKLAFYSRVISQQGFQ